MKQARLGVKNKNFNIFSAYNDRYPTHAKQSWCFYISSYRVTVYKKFLRILNIELMMQSLKLCIIIQGMVLQKLKF